MYYTTCIQSFTCYNRRKFTNSTYTEMNNIFLTLKLKINTTQDKSNDM